MAEFVLSSKILVGNRFAIQYDGPLFSIVFWKIPNINLMLPKARVSIYRPPAVLVFWGQKSQRFFICSFGFLKASPALVFHQKFVILQFLVDFFIFGLRGTERRTWAKKRPKIWVRQRSSPCFAVGCWKWWISHFQRRKSVTNAGFDVRGLRVTNPTSEWSLTPLFCELRCATKKNVTFNFLS